MSGILGGLIGSYSLLETGAFFQIATAYGTNSAGAITFSSIPQTYNHLQVRITARDTAVFGGRTIGVRVNADSTAAYYYHTIIGNGTAGSASGVTATTSILVGTLTDANSLANTYNSAIVDITDYASTTKNKTITTFNGYDVNGSGYISLSSGSRNNTAAINRLDFITNGSAFATGTIIALYGIKG